MNCIGRAEDEAENRPTERRRRDEDGAKFPPKQKNSTKTSPTRVRHPAKWNKQKKSVKNCTGESETQSTVRGPSETSAARMRTQTTMTKR